MLLLFIVLLLGKLVGLNRGCRRKRVCRVGGTWATGALLPTDVMISARA